MGTKRATMRDVAVASGVSPATVSFVLNGVSGQTISQATRDRVTRAASDLGYVPHGIARALREGTSRIVLLNLDPSFLGGSLDRYIRGLDDELSLHGHVLLVRHGLTSRSSLASVTDAVSPRAVINLAELYRTGGNADADGGWTDGLAAHTAVQVRYLAEKGHSRIAMVLPEDAEWARLASARLGFAREAAEMLGIGQIEVLALPKSGKLAAAALDRFRQQHPAVTALAAFNDDVALRLLPAIREHGLSVKQLAVIGFDDIELGAFSLPALTSVHIDAESFGRLAALNALGLDSTAVTPAGANVIVRDSA